MTLCSRDQILLTVTQQRLGIEVKTNEIVYIC